MRAVRHTCADRLLKILDGLFLAAVAAALLVVEPSELLKNLGVVWLPLQHTFVRRSRRIKLTRSVQQRTPTRNIKTEDGRVSAYLFLLFMDMADLEPDVFFGEGSRGVVDDVFEALRRVVRTSSDDDMVWCKIGRTHI